MSPDDRRLVVATLQSEAHQFDDQVRANQRQVYGYATAAFTLLAAVAPLLVAKTHYAVLLGLVPLALVIWILGVRTLAELFALAAHKYYIERNLAETLDDLTDRPIFIPWDDAGGKIARRSLSNIASFVALGVLTAIVCGTSLVAVWVNDKDLRWAATSEGAICIVLIVVIGISVHSMLGVWDRTLAALKECANVREADRPR